MHDSNLNLPFNWSAIFDFFSSSFPSKNKWTTGEESLRARKPWFIWIWSIKGDIFVWPIFDSRRADEANKHSQVFGDIWVYLSLSHYINVLSTIDMNIYRSVKKQLRITRLILSLVVELPSWYKRNLFRVRIKRHKFQITALLYAISTLFKYINFCYIRIPFEFYPRIT